MKYLLIKNWKKFQQYKDRNPPWIKLHFELLTSHDWVMLSDASRLLLVMCLMVASRHQGRVPYDGSYMRRVCHLKYVNFKPLIENGFLEEMQADDTKWLAETETETETDNKRDFFKKGVSNGQQKSTSGRDEGKRIAEKILNGEYAMDALG